MFSKICSINFSITAKQTKSIIFLKASIYKANHVTNIWYTFSLHNIWFKCRLLNSCESNNPPPGTALTCIKNPTSREKHYQHCLLAFIMHISFPLLFIIPKLRHKAEHHNLHKTLTLHASEPHENSTCVDSPSMLYPPRFRSLVPVVCKH